MTIPESTPVVALDEHLQAEAAAQAAERVVQEAEIAAYGIASQIGELEANRDRLVQKEVFVGALGELALSRANGSEGLEAPQPSTLWEKVLLKNVTRKTANLDEAKEAKTSMESKYGDKKLGGEKLIDTRLAQRATIKAAKKQYKAGEIDKYSYWQAKTNARNGYGLSGEKINVKGESKEQKKIRSDVTGAESSLLGVAERASEPSLLKNPIRTRRRANILATQTEIDNLRGYKGPEAGTPPQWRKEPGLLIEAPAPVSIIDPTPKAGAFEAANRKLIDLEDKAPIALKAINQRFAQKLIEDPSIANNENLATLVRYDVEQQVYAEFFGVPIERLGIDVQKTAISRLKHAIEASANKVDPAVAPEATNLKTKAQAKIDEDNEALRKLRGYIND